jgi:2-aminobenzoate-CoA ligase
MSQKDAFIQAGLPRPTQQAQRIFNTPELKALQQTKQANVVLRLLENPAFQRNTLFRSDSLTLTYAEASTQVNRIANYLKHQCHLHSGNRVLLRGVNSVELALAWLAVVKCGLIAVATMPLLRAKELREIIAKAQPSLFFCDAPLLHELLLAESHAKIITLNGTDSNSLLNLTQHERTVFPAFEAAPPASPKPPCTATVICSRLASAGHAMSCAPRPATSWLAPPRLPLPLAWAAS